VANLQLVDGRELQESAGGRRHERREGAHPPNLILVHRVRDEDDDEEQFKPLDWRLIRRLLVYAGPVRRKLWIMAAMTVIRGAQLPALAWLTATVITGPIAHGDLHGILTGTLISSRRSRS
jgi:hypothetical protein